jgi:hypothetical protein
MHNYIMNKNLSLFIVGIASLFWLHGMFKILEYIIPDKLQYHILLAIVGISIFYLNDGELNELGDIKSSHTPTKKKSAGIKKNKIK